MITVNERWVIQVDPNNYIEVRLSLSDGDKTLPEAVSTVARIRNEMSALLQQILEQGGNK